MSPGSRFLRRSAVHETTSVSVLSELNILLLGPPGAGKGTQADRLAADFPLAYIATGNMLREAVSQGTDLGKEAKAYMDAGDLVPDSLITQMAIDRVSADDARDGVLLDGFPRNLAQAEALDTALAAMDRKLSGVLLIDVPDEQIVKRISGRRMSKAGRVYHVDFDPPKQPDVCDVDGSTLIQRDDDKPDVVRKRLETYHAVTQPLVQFYEERGDLARIDGTRSPQEVHDHIRATVATWRLADEL
jgi:adenylate kinase